MFLALFRKNTHVAWLALFVVVSIFCLTDSAYAIGLIVDQDKAEEGEVIGWLPFVFKTSSLGTAVGVGGYSTGENQPQSEIFGTGFVTSNDSQLLMGGLTDLQLSGSGRVFVDIFAMVAHFTDERFYVRTSHDSSTANPGSNDSNKDDFVRGVSNNVILEATLKYPLSLGSARNNPITTYTLKDGLLVSKPQDGNKDVPFLEGKTILGATLFHVYRDLDEVNTDQLLSVNSNGFKLWLDHNNTDFSNNPSTGSRQKLLVQKDFGWLNKSQPWTNVELELTQYISFKKTKSFRQRVLALNFWTSNTLDWASDPPAHRPPPSMGSTLGGYDRMRAYPESRFRDKAATYYAAEFRVIPNIRPLRESALIKYFNIDWVQFVGFVEAGRVGSQYNSDLFVNDLKYDAGVSVRLMAFHAVVRLDYAVSDEGSSVWAMYEQPFARQ